MTGWRRGRKNTGSSRKRRSFVCLGPRETVCAGRFITTILIRSATEAGSQSALQPDLNSSLLITSPILSLFKTWVTPLKWYSLQPVTRHFIVSSVHIFYNKAVHSISLYTFYFFYVFTAYPAARSASNLFLVTLCHHPCPVLKVCQNQAEPGAEEPVKRVKYWRKHLVSINYAVL